MNTPDSPDEHDEEEDDRDSATFSIHDHLDEHARTASTTDTQHDNTDTSPQIKNLQQMISMAQADNDATLTTLLTERLHTAQRQHHLTKEQNYQQLIKNKAVIANATASKLANYQQTITQYDHQLQTLTNSRSTAKQERKQAKIDADLARDLAYAAADDAFTARERDINTEKERIGSLKTTLQ